MSAEFPEDKRAERVRWRFGCLSYAACFFVVIALLLGVLFRRWHVDAQADLEREMARIVSAGEPLWFVDFAPSPIDPDQDATPLYLAATARLKPLTEAFTTLVIAEPRTPPGEYPEFETTLELNRPALEVLAKAVRRPYFRLPLDYGTRRPISLLIEPIQQAREFARLLSADVLLSIVRADRARAATAIEEGLLLSEMLRDEPLLMTQMVRMAIATSALDSLETAVAHFDLAPDQFAAIDDLLATMQSRFTLRPSVLGERGMNLTTMQYIDQIDANDFGLRSTTPLRLLQSPVLRPYIMTDQAFMLRLMSDFAARVDMTGPEGDRAMEELERQLKAQVGPRRVSHVLSGLLVPSILQCRSAGLRHRQRLDTARLGIRVARYYAEHGEFPESLEQVTDAAFNAVPADFYTEAPLVYRVMPDGFTIYSIGPDGVNNGGGKQPDQTEGATRFEMRRP